MKTHPQLISSKHFRLEQLAEGVYAAIHIDGGAAIGNAGIVDLGDRTLVYDALFTPQAGDDLRSAAEALTGRDVDAVIDSHYHNDHIWGNQSFGPATDIIATAETQRLIVTTKGHGDYKSFRESAPANLASTRAQLEATRDEGQRRQLTLWLDYYQSFVEAEPTLQVRSPNVAFTQRLAFHGTERSAELIAFSGGHTVSDAVLFLPQEGIVFMSDLLFIGHHPWLGECEPEKVLQILDEVSGLRPQALVPGHGPVGTPDSLQVMGQYVATMDGLARDMVQRGEPEGLIDQMGIPEPFEDWLFASFVPRNLHILYQRHASGQNDS